MGIFRDKQEAVENIFKTLKEVTEKTKDISPRSYKIIPFFRALSLKNINQQI